MYACYRTWNVRERQEGENRDVSLFPAGQRNDSRKTLLSARSVQIKTHKKEVQLWMKRTLPYTSYLVMIRIALSCLSIVIDAIFSGEISFRADVVIFSPSR